MTRKCPACGSEKVIPNVRLVGDMYRGFFFNGNPDALMFRDRHGGKYTREMCGDCGVITLRAEDPATAWKEFQQTVEGKKNATAT